MSDVGTPLPAPFTVSSAEELLPFFGSGAIATNQPAALLWFAPDSPDGLVDNTLAVPLKPDANPLEKLHELNAKEIDGHADALLFEDMLVVRRSAGYAYLADKIDGPAKATDEMVPAGVKDSPFPLTDAGTVLTASFNLSTFRQSAAASAARFFEDLDKPDENVTDVARSLRHQATNLLVKQFDRVDAAVLREGANLSLKASIAPSSFRAPLVMPKLELPQSNIARVDLNFGSRDDAASFFPVAQTILNSSHLIESFNIDPATGDSVRTLFSRLFESVLYCESLSVAVQQQTSGNLVYYVAAQSRRPNDLVGLLQSLATEANTLAQTAKAEHDPVQVSQYTVGEKSITRLTFFQHGEHAYWLDATPIDMGTLFTFAQDDVHHIESIAGAKKIGDLKQFCEADADAGTAIEFVCWALSIPNSEFPADVRRRVIDASHGKRITASANPLNGNWMINAAVQIDDVKQTAHLVVAP